MPLDCTSGAAHSDAARLYYGADLSDGWREAARQMPLRGRMASLQSGRDTPETRAASERNGATTHVRGTLIMKRCIEQNRILFILNSSVFLCIVIGWILYALFGHRLIEAMYKGESIGFLNSIIAGQSIHPLVHYLQDAENIMWVISLLAIVSSSVLTLLIKTLPSLVTVLEPAAPFLARCTITALSRYTVTVLTTIFCLFSLSASAIVFFYPLEVETRESTVWLYVLALRQGISIYDHSRVAFVNMNHGPFDPLFKLLITLLCPFLEPWHIVRFAVFLLPFVYLLIAWKLV